MARREQRRDLRFPAVHRTDGVDDVAREQTAGGRDDGFAGREAVGIAARPQPLALREDLGSPAAMDRAVDAATAEQGMIGGVHDRIDGREREIALHEAHDTAGDRDGGRVAHTRFLQLDSLRGLPSMPRLVGNRAQNAARRVVVTGTGLVTPLGTGVEKNWTALMAGRSGIGPITRFECADFPTRIAGEVRDFVPEDWIERREIKKMDPFIQFAVAAAQMAMDQSGLKISPADADRVGTIVGVGMGGIQSIEQFHTLYLESRLRRVSPFFVAKVIANLAPGQISIRFGARGINYTPTSACASGANAVGEAFRNIRDGYQDAVIAGGSEAALCGLGIGGFIAMRALSTRNDEPERASRPFDRGRDGFVMAEGAGILVLESLEHAEARGARILGELVGYGANADAFHITAPAPGGEGAARCMQQALADADVAPARGRLRQRPRHLDRVQRRERDARRSARSSASMPGGSR